MNRGLKSVEIVFASLKDLAKAGKFKPAFATLISCFFISGAGLIAQETSEGEQLYQHYCGFCHITNPRFAPPLSAPFIQGRKEMVHETVMNGGVQMPAFKYMLNHNQVDSILEYLLTQQQPPSGISSEPFGLVATGGYPKGNSATDGIGPRLLTGKVLSPNGDPVVGATITAKLSGSPLSISVYTDDQGKYYFTPIVQGGDYLVTAQLVGYERAIAELKLNPGINRADLEFTDTTAPLYQLSGWRQLSMLPEETRADRRGKALMLMMCTGCHQTSRIFTRRFDEKSWNMVIESMYASVGADETTGAGRPELRKELAAYLARYAGPTEPKLLPAPDIRPEGQAKYSLIYEYAIANMAGRFSFDKGDWADGPANTRSSVGVGLHDATVDKEGNVWFSSPVPFNGRTIARMDADTGELTNVGYPSYIPGRTAMSHGLISDSKGRIWFTNIRVAAGADAELGFMDPTTGEARSFAVPEGADMIGGWLNEGGDGTIWTSAGMYRGNAGAWRFDPQTEEFTQYKSLSEGMSYGVAPDSNGNGWWTQITVDKIGYANVETGEVGEIELPFTWSGVPFLKEGDMTKEEYLSSIYGVTLVPGYSQMPRRAKADLNSDMVWIANYHANTLMGIHNQTFEESIYLLPGDGMHAYDVGVDSSHKVWMGLQNADEAIRFNPDTETWDIFPLPTRGVSSRSLMVVEREGHVEVVAAANDAAKVVRMIVRTADEVDELKRTYYGVQ